MNEEKDGEEPEAEDKEDEADLPRGDSLGDSWLIFPRQPEEEFCDVCGTLRSDCQSVCLFGVQVTYNDVA